MESPSIGRQVNRYLVTEFSGSPIQIKLETLFAHLVLSLWKYKGTVINITEVSMIVIIKTELLTVHYTRNKLPGESGTMYVCDESLALRSKQDPSTVYTHCTYANSRPGPKYL